MHKVILVITMIVLATTSCTQRSGPREIAAGRLMKKDQTAQKIEEAKALYDIGEIDAAIDKLRLYVDSNVYDPSHDQAYELIVEWLLQVKRYEEAKRLASYFMANYSKSPSVQKIIDMFNSMSKPTQSESIPDINENDESSTDDYSEQIIDLENSISRAKEAEDKTELTKLTHFLLFEAPLALVDEIAKKKRKNLVYGLAQMRRALYQFQRGDLSKSYELVNASYPHVLAKEQEHLALLKKDLEDIADVDKKAIGILLPLSGPYASFGQRTLNAMSIALDIKLDVLDDKKAIFYKDGLRIAIRDSKSDQNHARAMTEELIKNEHVALIIGEITNEASFAAAQICEQFGVPMLSLSRHQQIYSIGSNIFVFNASLYQQIEKLVDYAMNTKAHKRFAILYPRHNYGWSMSQIFFDQVISKGGEITGIESYDAHETTFMEPVQKLVGKYYVKQRPEYLACLKTGNDTTCKNELKPIIDFDAIFIPEFKLAYVVPELRRQDILVSNNASLKNAYSLATKIATPHYVQLLGPSSWNDEGVLKKIGTQMDGAYFVDSISFTTEENKVFSEAFVKLNDTTPTSLDVFAHDAIRLAIRILEKDMPTKDSVRRQIRDDIAKFNDRVGLLSNVSFKENGELDAKEYGYEIKNGAAHVDINS